MGCPSWHGFFSESERETGLWYRHQRRPRRLCEQNCSHRGGRSPRPVATRLFAKGAQSRDGTRKAYGVVAEERHDLATANDAAREKDWTVEHGPRTSSRPAYSSRSKKGRTAQWEARSQSRTARDTTWEAGINALESWPQSRTAAVAGPLTSIAGLPAATRASS